MRIKFAAALMSALTMGGATAASAQDSVQDAANGSGAASTAVVDFGSAGIKTVVGVAVLPLSIGAGASMVGGSVAMGVGQAAFSTGSAASQAAGGAADVASGRLALSPEVIVAPQARLNVPYEAQAPR